MASIIYKGTAVYKIQNIMEEYNIHLYIERQETEYHCIAYNPDTGHMIDYCCFIEPLFIQPWRHF